MHEIIILAVIFVVMLVLGIYLGPIIEKPIDHAFGYKKVTHKKLVKLGWIQIAVAIIWVSIALLLQHYLKFNDIIAAGLAIVVPVIITVWIYEKRLT